MQSAHLPIALSTLLVIQLIDLYSNLPTSNVVNYTDFDHISYYSAVSAIKLKYQSTHETCIHISRLSCTEDLYRDAERIADYKRREYARLKELYYVAPTDVSMKHQIVMVLFFWDDSFSQTFQYDAAFNIERSSPSLENIKAQNLVEYQLLFKQKEDKHFCKRRTFQECVNESAKVAAENKCLPLLGKCDRNAKYAHLHTWDTFKFD